MLRKSLVRTLCCLAITLCAQHALATTTYLVGTCKTGLKTFSSISSALAFIPAPNTVEVCPGTYAEQVEVTIPVTIEGIAADNSAQPIIVPPANGFVANATDDFGQTLVVQVYVHNVGIFEANGSVAVPITSNKIYDSGEWAIETTLTEAITGNTITNAPIGIEFVCAANPNVKSNTFNDVVTALNDVPTGTTSTNSYYNVGTILSAGTCTSDAARPQVIPLGQGRR